MKAFPAERYVVEYPVQGIFEPSYPGFVGLLKRGIKEEVEERLPRKLSKKITLTGLVRFRHFST
jgi:hypothetical protein